MVCGMVWVCGNTHHVHTARLMRAHMHTSSKQPPQPTQHMRTHIQHATPRTSTHRHVHTQTHTEFLRLALGVRFFIIMVGTPIMLVAFGIHLSASSTLNFGRKIIDPPTIANRLQATSNP